MPTTIKLKNSVTTTNVPSSLAQGEVAINVTDKKVWVGNAATTPVQLLGAGSDGSFTNISVSGVASFADGTVSLPAIANIGDTNTGIFFPAADTIAFSEGGAESMRIDSSGNVGIGTSSPSEKLHVAGAGRFTGLAASLDTTGAFIDYASGVARIAGQASTGGTLAFYTNPNANFQAERMRIDSSGKVGVGTSSPSSYDSSSLMAVVSASNTSITVGSGSTGLGQILFANGTSGASVYNGLIRYDHNGNAMSFFTNGGNQRMIIDSSGNLFVNTANSALTIGSATAQGCSLATVQTGTGFQFSAKFLNDNGVVGSITTSGSGTAFNTSSDYRLKENIAPMTGALATVQALKPVTYKWKVDGSNGQGFIAHELQEVVPDCVTGEKDEVEMQTYEISPAVKATYDEEGNELTPLVEAVMGEREVPRYQGIDTSFLVATLTAAIQELKAIVDAQATRIEALENK
jgi:hypothetical protein